MKQSLINKVYDTNECGPVKVQRKEGSRYFVEFLNLTKRGISHQQWTTKDLILRGALRYPYKYRLIWGVGNVGPYVYDNQDHVYKAWYNMLKRQTIQFWDTSPSYEGTTVCPEWYEYDTFRRWYTRELKFIETRVQKYDIKIKGTKNALYEIDKDLLHPSKPCSYGPLTCCVIPYDLNRLTTYRKNNGTLMTGVTFNRNTVTKPYMVQCSIKGIQMTLGYFRSELEAFNCYKKAKEAEIHRVAKYYKRVLRPHVYEALMNYEILP